MTVQRTIERTPGEGTSPLPRSSKISGQVIWQPAFSDIIQGLKGWRIWTMLASQDIRLRYRRSTLGPLWLTLSMAITIYSMGFLYSHLFHANLDNYFPYITAAMLTWSLISTVVTDLVEAFSSSESLIKQVKLPYTLYIHRIVWRSILIFFHNVIVIIPILIIFHDSAKVNMATFLLIPGLLLLYLNAFFYGVIFAMLGARFRDISPIIKSLIQVIFFMTPVMWLPSVLPEKYHFIFIFNPFYAFLNLIASPLIGQVPTVDSVNYVLLITLLGMAIMLFVFPRFRARIIYWL